MKNIEVRICGRDDVPLLSAVGSRVFKETYGGFSDPADLAAHVEENFSERAIAKEISRSTVRYFMAEVSESCAGLVKLRQAPGPDLLPTKNVFEVQQLYISSDFQRRGVGKLLLDTAAAHARSKGADGLFLSVWSEAEWALSFYRKYGFETLGEIPFRLGETVYIDLLMWLPFPESAEER